jgi:NAD(P)-dependent dehydrogenase (short-subunit alcohol dehydrogenase family)
MNWSVEEIGDLSGKTVVITGANSGIGFEATKIFSAKGAHVVMACRSMERAQRAFDTIKTEQQDAKLTIMPLDLSSFDSIRQFASAFLSKYDTIDILLNNAGIMMVPYGHTSDGLERQQGVNHFGHFLLTSLLFDALKKSTEGRIVNISSIAHRFGKMNFDNLMYKDGKGYRTFRAYGRSKLENLLFTYELARRVEEAGLSIKVLAAHPGISSTNLGHHIYSSGVYKVFHFVSKSWTQDAYNGSLPGVMAATDPNAANGTFYGPSKLFGVRGKPNVCTSTKRSKNNQLQQQLWQGSEQLTKTTFTI